MVTKRERFEDNTSDDATPEELELLKKLNPEAKTALEELASMKNVTVLTALRQAIELDAKLTPGTRIIVKSGDVLRQIYPRDEGDTSPASDQEDLPRN